MVPPIHRFHTQTGRPRRLNPLMQICAPNLNGSARLSERAFDVAVGGLALFLVSPRVRT